MLLKMINLKRNEADETNSQESGESKDSKTTETDGGLDDLGYPIQKPASEPEKKQPDKADVKKAEKKDPPGDEEKDSTGYGDVDVEEKKADPPPADDKKKDPPAEEKKDGDELKIEVKDLPADESKRLVEFAKTHKMSKEQAQALGELRSNDIKALNQQIEEENKAFTDLVNNQKIQWKKDLLKDKDFSGVDGSEYDHNHKIVKNAFNEFFPETKKMLDSNKGVLPPSTMKDILAIAKILNPKGSTLKEGDLPVDGSDKSSKSEWDDFYS